jgi:type I restriction enzyme M protein
VLSRTARLLVDRLWDTAWSNGITSPIACVEVLTVVLSAPSRPALRAAIDERSAGAIEREVEALHSLAGIDDLGAASTLACQPDLAAALLTVADEIHRADGTDGTAPGQDRLGDLFEHILRRMATAGHFGQFRTPRHLVDFVVALVDPQADERVLDPACGTGGFLIGAAQHGTEPSHLRGEEIDGSVARLARLNVLAHGLDSAHVAVTDGLLEQRDADVILANPPFGGSVRRDVARRFTSPSAKTELLFLEHMLDRLVDGGRAGVIVPWGVIANRTQGADAIRRRLIDANDLRAVIELPAGAFRPYTDSRTAVLVWHGGGKTDATFVARARADGFSLDDRREPQADDDLPTLLTAFRGGTDLVDASELRANGYLLTPTAYRRDRGRRRTREAPRPDHDALDQAIVAIQPVIAELSLAVEALDATSVHERTADEATDPGHGDRGASRAGGQRAASNTESRTLAPDGGEPSTLTLAVVESKETRRARARFGVAAPGTIGELVLFCTAAIDADAIDPATPYVGLEHLEPETGAHRWIAAGDAAIRSPKGVFRRGDVLYGRLRPNLRKGAVATVDGVSSADIFVLRPHDPALGPLLALFLRSEPFAAHATEAATGANLPRLAARDLLATPFVLPPEPERSRLVAAATAALRACRLAADVDAGLAAVESAIAQQIGLD